MGKLSKYNNFLLFSVLIISILRIIEFTAVLVLFDTSEKPLALFQEIVGLFYDIGLIIAFIIFFYFIEWLFRLKKVNLAFVYLNIFNLFWIAQSLLLAYFFVEKNTLGEVFFQHSIAEIVFFTKTAGIQFTPIIISILIELIIINLIYYIYTKRKPKIDTFNKSYLLVFGISFFVFVSNFFIKATNNYSINKTVYFVESAFDFYLSKKIDLTYSKSKIEEYQQLFPKNYINNKYPFYHIPDTTNYLESYFGKFDQKPNIVLLIVEGLNDDYIQKRDNTVLMPYLNSLKDSSLYWSNCFTLGERSFAAVPSTTGGLPYGTKCFTELEIYPTFLSLISIVKKNNYHVISYEGQDSWYLNRDRYYANEGVDYNFDKNKYPESAPKIMHGDFVLSYDDKTIYKEALRIKSKNTIYPYFDIYFTHSMHFPFKVYNEPHYSATFEKLVKKCTSTAYKNQLQANKKYYLTTLYADDAINYFLKAYSKRPEYKNTIFIITGDHPMNEAPRENALKKYHVPLIIYSPQLIKTGKSNNIVSHLDIFQTMLNILRGYGVRVPTTSASLGSVLKMKEKDMDRTVAFMNVNRKISEIYDNGYFFSNETLYKVDVNNQNITSYKDEKIEALLRKKLELFNYVNLYSTLKNRLLPFEDYLAFMEKEKNAYFKQSKSIKSKEEYIPITKFEVNQQVDYFVESRLNIQVINPNTYLIIQVEDKNKNIVYWDSHTLEVGKKLYSFLNKIPANVFKSNEVISAYIWNKDKIEITLNSCEIKSFKSFNQKN
ncbi:MAG: LTA synthase family protein [Crocinitomicaceae bacterium]|nr:LTA synthase family protein [Crocinitomicaceae bacterium]